MFQASSRGPHLIAGYRICQWCPHTFVPFVRSFVSLDTLPLRVVVVVVYGIHTTHGMMLIRS
jgi:hypothetical protein